MTRRLRQFLTGLTMLALAFGASAALAGPPAVADARPLLRVMSPADAAPDPVPPTVRLADPTTEVTDHGARVTEPAPAIHSGATPAGDAGRLPADAEVRTPAGRTAAGPLGQRAPPQR
ncbi:hypothetical protein O7627_31730 [Solwaraspora sp. WMMD1047]|uniref:hypothetical protein n=1 Tax=Solwaraspora sp. WMMD1047 TaxID=3016102 RepID=UPI00241758C4|nr:hypothetical protein [Solwaraspora sp. WMMD1047]MDG4833847.1 hypothetical protein [Solwaraspora sp. WMMD1047]